MNHGALLRRAFDITRRFRVLWLFGLLVVLTGGGTPGPGLNYDLSRGNLPGGKWPDWLPADQWARQWDEITGRFDPSPYSGLIALCCCLLVLLAIAALIIQYAARTSLMRSVDRVAADGRAPSWRQGWRLGWCSRAFRLWLLELIVTLLILPAVIALLAAAASPLLLLLTGSDAGMAAGVILAVMLGVLAVLAVITAVIGLSVLGQFWAREIVLGDRSIGGALTAGYAEARGRLKDLGVLWLMMAGIRVAFTVVLVPVLFLLVAFAALLGGGLGYAVYALAGSVPWAIAAGLPVSLLIVAASLAFIGGVYEAFKSSVWTLAYRDVVPAGPP